MGGSDFTVPVTTLLRDRCGRGESAERQTTAGRHKGKWGWGVGRPGWGQINPRDYCHTVQAPHGPFSARSQKKKSKKKKNMRERFDVQPVSN